jgi:hypothetical protein
MRAAWALMCAILAGGAASAARAQSFITYALASPAGCAGRVPDHPNVPVPHDPLYWSGRCVGGWMQGEGELKRYRGGVLQERSLTHMAAGIREGYDVSVYLAPGSRLSNTQTYSRWSAGFPYGEMRTLGPGGEVLNVWDTDGRGGIVQTMNPLNPLLGELGRAVSRDKPGLWLFVMMLANGRAAPSGSPSDACQTLMRAQGYSSDVYGFWCTGLPSN